MIQKVSHHRHSDTPMPMAVISCLHNFHKAYINPEFCAKVNNTSKLTHESGRMER